MFNPPLQNSGGVETPQPPSLFGASGSVAFFRIMPDMPPRTKIYACAHAGMLRILSAYVDLSSYFFYFVRGKLLEIRWFNTISTNEKKVKGH